MTQPQPPSPGLVDESASEFRTIRLHGLRDTHASIPLKADVPVKCCANARTPQPALTITAYQHVLPSEAQSRLRSNKQLWRDIHRDGVVTHGLTIRELSEAIHA